VVRQFIVLFVIFVEPYDFASWCLILIFSVHASGAALFLVEWLSPNGLDRGLKPIRGLSISLVIGRLCLLLKTFHIRVSSALLVMIYSEYAKSEIVQAIFILIYDVKSLYFCQNFARLSPSKFSIFSRGVT